MFGDGALTFREFAMGEPLPLATIHDAILDFLRDRDDVALFGAQAVNALPRIEWIQKIQVIGPPDLIADKIRVSMFRGRGPKRYSDMADLLRLLSAFPDLKTRDGPVRERLIAASASDEVLASWDELVAQTIEPEDDADEFDYQSIRHDEY